MSLRCHPSATPSRCLNGTDPPMVHSSLIVCLRSEIELTQSSTASQVSPSKYSPTKLVPSFFLRPGQQLGWEWQRNASRRMIRWDMVSHGFNMFQCFALSFWNFLHLELNDLLSWYVIIISQLSLIGNLSQVWGLTGWWLQEALHGHHGRAGKSHSSWLLVCSRREPYINWQEVRLPTQQRLSLVVVWNWDFKALSSSSRTLLSVLRLLSNVISQLAPRCQKTKRIQRPRSQRQQNLGCSSERKFSVLGQQFARNPSVVWWIPQVVCPCRIYCKQSCFELLKLKSLRLLWCKYPCDPVSSHKQGSDRPWLSQANLWKLISSHLNVSFWGLGKCHPVLGRLPGGPGR